MTQSNVKYDKNLARLQNRLAELTSMQSHEVYKLDKDVISLKEKLALSENKNKKLRRQC